MTALNWTFGLLGLSVATGERAVVIARRAFTRPFLAAFVYFALAAIVMANLLDGSIGGYLLTSVVAILSVTLREALSERRSRTALEEHVADSQRYLGYSRALEGVVHSLRHQLAITKGYLEDVMETTLPPGTGSTAERAKMSTDAALTILDRLQASASPRVHFADQPVSLLDVASSGGELMRGLSGAQRTRLELPGQSRPVYVRADPTLLRDVLAALLINALQAVEHGGSVSVSVDTRRGGFGSLTVADSGPGLNEQQRDHLFEPHYTTKQGGTGMGLFTAFGVVREHRGQLIYEGDGKQGAVFTVLIPLAPASAKSAEAVAETRDGLNPSTIAKRLSG
jgi:signal transduction histidine kinase